MRGKYQKKRDARLTNPTPTQNMKKIAAVFAMVDLTKLSPVSLNPDEIFSEEWKLLNEQASAATEDYLAANWPAIIDEFADESDGDDDDVHISLCRYLIVKSDDWFGDGAPMDVQEAIDRFFTEDEYRWYG